MKNKTPKEEAKEIMKLFYEAITMCEGTGSWKDDESSLIMVNRLIEEIRSKHWYEVRREIENMKYAEIKH
jgi:Ribonuclease G/E